MLQCLAGMVRGDGQDAGGPAERATVVEDPPTAARSSGPATSDPAARAAIPGDLQATRDGPAKAAVSGDLPATRVGPASAGRGASPEVATVELAQGRRIAGSSEVAAQLGETVAPAGEGAFDWSRAALGGLGETVSPELRRRLAPAARDLAVTADSIARSVAEVRPLPDTPARLGRYMVIKRLGAGGMGVVYKAYDPDLDRKVAVKLLLGQATPHARARLLREAQAMAKLAHPNVVRVFDVGEVGGQVFVAMDFVDGLSLHEWMEARHPWPEVLELFVQAGQGLAAAHAVGLIHRDFKPKSTDRRAGNVT